MAMPNRIIPKLNVRQLLRFWSRMDAHDLRECWEWQRAKDENGYGVCDFFNRQYRCSRVAYTLAFGVIPEGLQVLHRCDNPPCCNPLHLWVGTNLDNSHDCTSKGRHASPAGELNPMAILTEEQVRQIRKGVGDGTRTQAYFHRLFKVSRATVSLVVLDRVWKHVK